MTEKDDTLRKAGCKDWRELSRVLTRAQGKVARGEPLSEREMQVWTVATYVPPGSRVMHL